MPSEMPTLLPRGDGIGGLSRHGRTRPRNPPWHGDPTEPAQPRATG